MTGKFWRFLMDNKLWWIPPVVLVVGLVAFLLFASIFADPEFNRPFVYDKFW